MPAAQPGSGAQAAISQGIEPLSLLCRRHPATWKIPRIRDAALFMFSQAWALFMRTWNEESASGISAWSAAPCLSGWINRFCLFKPTCSYTGKNPKKDKMRMVQRAAIQAGERFGLGAVTLGAALNMPDESAVT